MKKFATFLGLAFSAISANAGTVLIDFDDVTPQTASGGLYNVETKGFTFDATTDSASDPWAGVNSVGGIWSEGLCFEYGAGCGADIFMETISGSAFSIHSIGSWEGSFYGYTNRSELTAADLSVPIGTGDWLSLEYFWVSNNCLSEPCGYYQASLDDITASIVPIPAAAWLFGSAIAGLGWIRRRQL